MCFTSLIIPGFHFLRGPELFFHLSTRRLNFVKYNRQIALRYPNCISGSGHDRQLQATTPAGTTDEHFDVTVNLTSTVNADLSAEHVSGQIYLDVRNVMRESEEKSSNVRARIGAGGTPITISSVSGNIPLTRS
jgi:hypothetical protein